MLEACPLVAQECHPFLLAESCSLLGDINATEAASFTSIFMANKFSQPKEIVHFQDTHWELEQVQVRNRREDGSRNHFASILFKPQELLRAFAHGDEDADAKANPQEPRHGQDYQELSPKIRRHQRPAVLRHNLQSPIHTQLLREDLDLHIVHPALFFRRLCVDGAVQGRMRIVVEDPVGEREIFHSCNTVLSQLQAFELHWGSKVFDLGQHGRKAPEVGLPASLVMRPSVRAALRSEVWNGANARVVDAVRHSPRIGKVLWRIG
mmetsp:Transcript_71132/g.169815  ORF Transcript_71132/g.169815 Transcript_71132/m.169815 type:complete len:265 (-) Transcript_71132:797-1591(-)